MTILNPRMIFLGWIFASVISFGAAIMSYFQNGEIFSGPLTFGIIFLGVAILTKPRNPLPPK